MKNHTRIAAGAACLMLSSAAIAFEGGDWLVRAGTHYVDPKGDNHPTVGVEGAFGLTASVSYFVTPTMAIDLLVAVPFEHDIELNADGSEVGSTQHLPPTLSAVWYPQVSGKWQPYIGAGLNYTMFFEEETRGALAGASLKLDDSVGLAATAGLDYSINEQFGVTLDVRYFDIDTDASLNGASIDDVEIDPWGYGLSLSYRF